MWLSGLHILLHLISGSLNVLFLIFQFTSSKPKDSMEVNLFQVTKLENEILWDWSPGGLPGSDVYTSLPHNHGFEPYSILPSSFSILSADSKLYLLSTSSLSGSKKGLQCSNLAKAHGVYQFSSDLVSQWHLRIVHFLLVKALVFWVPTYSPSCAPS